MARKWTEEEKFYLEEKWGTLSVKVLAKRFNRTETAVIRFAEKNGFGSMYREGTLTTKQISKMFNVNIGTVRTYWIGKHGLKATKKALKNRRCWRVRMEDLIDWCEHNQDKWKSNHLELYALSIEPEWLKEKRKRDNNEFTEKKGTSWSISEITKLRNLVEEGYTSKEIAKIMNRSKCSIDGQKTRSEIKSRK